ncbi:MAG: copper chaperone PCu(A)C [Reyranella sp.]
MNLFRRARGVLTGSPDAPPSRSYTMGEIEIGGPWARASSVDASFAGGYFTFTNKGATPDRLVSATSPAAERVEIHAIKVVGPELKMRQREGGLAIPSATTLTLKPRGYHLLLTGLKKPLQQGENIAITLTFEVAGILDIECVVAEPGPVGQLTL